MLFNYASMKMSACPAILRHKFWRSPRELFTAIKRLIAAPNQRFLVEKNLHRTLVVCQLQNATIETNL